jgi:DNA-binding response OmpR family regulator
VNRCPTCGQSAAAAYLGLFFDWKARLVSREGFRAVRLSTSLILMLDALAVGRGQAVSESVLLGAYRGGTATCARLISKKVSFIRIAIRPLGLGIETVRGEGYRLIESAAEANAA